MKIKWEWAALNAAFNKAETEALVRTATRIVADARSRLRDQGAIFTGNLRGSIAHSAVERRQGFHKINIGFVGGVTDAFRYAMVIEKGRTPGKKMPPPSELELWVERKLGAGRTWKGKKEGASYARKGSRRMSNLTAREKEIKTAAFLIARAIGKRGTKPRPFLMPAWDAHAGKLISDFKAIFKRELKARLPQE